MNRRRDGWWRRETFKTSNTWENLWFLHEENINSTQYIVMCHRTEICDVWDCGLSQETTGLSGAGQWCMWAVAPLIGPLSGASASDWSDQSVTYLGYHHLARVTFCWHEEIRRSAECHILSPHWLIFTVTWGVHVHVCPGIRVLGKMFYPCSHPIKIRDNFIRISDWT